MRENGTLTWLLSDNLGSTSTTAAADGSLLDSVKYTAFGEIRDGATATDYRYTGQRDEFEIGLYYYVARYYDPVVGRFISADTIVPQPESSQAYDRYAYSNNNPINYTDPTGHYACADFDENGKCIPEKTSKVTGLTTPTLASSYNGIVAAQWAIKNQQTRVSCWGSSTCTCFVSTAINEGAGKEILRPNTEEFNRTPSFYDHLTSGEVYKVPSIKYFDTQNAPPYNLTSATWKTWLQENMPQPGDIILYHNALNNSGYSHAAMVVGYSAEGWPLVVDQSNGNETIAQPHPIDDTSSTDIWDVAIIYFSKWKEE